MTVQQRVCAALLLLAVVLVRFALALDSRTTPTVPVVNANEMVRRFYGSTLPPHAACNAQIGAARDFQITLTRSGTLETVSATLMVVRGPVQIWVQDELSFPADQLERFANRVEREAVAFNQALWDEAEEARPVCEMPFLFSNRVASAAAAYFTSTALVIVDGQPQPVTPNLILMNDRTLREPLDRDENISTAAHEAQHFLRYLRNPGELTWLNEGFSMLTEHLLFPQQPLDFASAFLANPGQSLEAFGLDDYILDDYGAAQLFMVYFETRYGSAGLDLLNEQSAIGIAAVDATLQALDSTSFDSFFADWVVANYAQQAGSMYGYETAIGHRPTLTGIDLAGEQSWQAHPNSTRYFALPTEAQDLQITFDFEPLVSLFPATSANDTSFLYSTRTNNGNPRATLQVDLSAAETANLRFRTWYDIEAGWDAAYITASVDGERWQILESTRSTRANPNGKAFGPHLAGSSGGWVAEAVSLDALIGHPEVSLRFEMITDDAIAPTGWMIDDVAIDALGYLEDFETPTDWQLEGWVQRTDGIPQRMLAQVIALGPHGVVVDRHWLAQPGTFHARIPAQTERAVLAVSPLVRDTLQSVSYTVRVENDL